MASAKKKFASQASPRVLREVKKIAKQEGRHFQSVLDEALRDFIEKKRSAIPRKQVLKVLEQSLTSSNELYKARAKHRIEIHPAAQVSEKVKIGRNVVIGPFAMIEDDVEIGDDSIIHTHAVIRNFVKMGANNIVFPHAVIGETPQDVTFDPKLKSHIIIGHHNVFREGVTIHRPTVADAATLIGSNCYFMNNSHVAHDCHVGDGSIFASCATLGGFVEVGEKVFFGGGVMVHQFCRIGSLAIVGGVTAVRKDVLPFSVIAGDPARHYKINSIGLRRAGITGDRYKAISQAFRCLRYGKSLEGLPKTPEIEYLFEWLAAESNRGISGFIRIQHASLS